MKQIIFLFSLLVIALSVNAQTKVDSNTIKPTAATYVPFVYVEDYNGVGDTIIKTGTFSIIINLNNEAKVAYDAAVQITKVSGTAAGKFYVYGRKFTYQSWTKIDSLAITDFTGTSQFIITNATAQMVKQLKLVIDPTDATTQKLKIGWGKLNLYR